MDSMVPLRKGEEGFGLVEAAIVLAIISVFAGVGISAFNCVRRRAISQAAQTTIQQIKDECESNYVYGIDEFTATNPSQYQITSSGNNSCSDGTVSLVPSDKTLYPTYFYKFNESELSYNFKGQTGTSFVACNKLICGESESKKINLDQDFVIADTYIERGCSAYVAVKGPTWEEAEANAKKLGGHLATINSEEENDWIANEFGNEKYYYTDDSNPGDPESWKHFWIGANDKNSEGQWEWSNGEEMSFNKELESEALKANYQYPDRDYIAIIFNVHYIGNYYWSNGENHYDPNNNNRFRGLAEISICN